MKADHRIALHLAWAVVGFGCGSSTPPPTVPTEPAASASAAPPPGDPSATAAVPSPPAEPPKAERPTPAPDTSLEKPTRPVRSIIESADTVFFLNYEESDPGKTAESNCAKESGGDPQKNTACMGKAKQNLEGLGYRFKKAAKGDVTTCTIVKRTGNSLATQHKFRYKYGEETENSIVIKMDGKDDGPVKWEKIPSEFKVDVPNDYMLTMQDPKYGKLVYYAKAGIPGD